MTYHVTTGSWICRRVGQRTTVGGGELWEGAEQQAPGGGELHEGAGQQAMKEGQGSYKRAAVTFWCTDSCAGLLVFINAFDKYKKVDTTLMNQISIPSCVCTCMYVYVYDCLCLCLYFPIFLMYFLHWIN